MHRAELPKAGQRAYSAGMERNFHRTASMRIMAGIGLIALATSSAGAQEAPPDEIDSVHQEEQSFEDGFADFDIAPLPHEHPEHAVDITEIEAPEELSSGDVVRDLGTGHASYYGRRFAGRPTASGEAFDPRELTAAHKSLPFGSLVRVTNVRNGRSVIVRINDRGPYVEGREIDLSRAAAEEIGLVRRGVGEVRIELLAS